jgi:hypothetical protein
MITDIDLWVDSNERDIILGKKHYRTYGFPRSYYKISHYTDELLSQLSYPSIKLWHICMHRLSSSTNKTSCVALDMRYPLFKEQFKRNSFYVGLKELVRYRLILPTTDRFIYVVNIQHAHKLNSPYTYDPSARPVTGFEDHRKTMEANEPYDDGDTRPLAF